MVSEQVRSHGSICLYIKKKKKHQKPFRKNIKEDEALQLTRGCEEVGRSDGIARPDGNSITTTMIVCVGLAMTVRRLGEASTTPVVGQGDGNDSWTEP